MFKRLLGSGNRRVRLLVLLMLVALFCIHCAGPITDSDVRAIAVTIDHNATPDQIARTAHQLAAKEHLALLEYCVRNYNEKYRDYTSTLVKQERLGGVIGKEQELTVKFKESPFSVAMAWTRNPPQGDRVLYIEGKYDNDMLVRPSNPMLRSLCPTARRKPDGEEARKSTLRTVNLFGFKRSLDSLIEVYSQAKKAGDLKEEAAQDATLEGRKCIMLVRYLPQKDEYPACKTIVYIDQEYLVPVFIEGRGWRNDEFLCRYWYRDLKFNTGLKDADFAPEVNELVCPQ